MTNLDTTPPVNLQELVVSSLAMCDALAKLLIEKGLVTQEEFMREAIGRTGNLSKTAQSYAAMIILDIILWEGITGLLLIPVVIAFVMLLRWMRGRPSFTERDWVFLFGHRREKVLSPPMAQIRGTLVHCSSHRLY